MGEAVPRGQPPLDDVMLAMDVVDTLRHREDWISRELDDASREADLMARLRAIYASQGIDVSDEVLSQGIKALGEDRFAYEPPQPGLAISLARLWVDRGRHAKRLAALLILFAALAGAYYETRVRPFRETAAALTEVYSTAVAAAAGQAGRERADRLLAVGNAAIEDRDAGSAQEALSALQALSGDLAREYRLRIVSTAWKQPPTALHERIYFLIVEAVAADGGILRMSASPDGSSAPEVVTRWGIQVSRDVFAPVDQDLRDDGRIDDDLLGVKRRGEPDVEFLKPVLGNTITQW